MRLFLDSANLSEIEHALELGMVDGLTTNPTLLAREGGDWEGRAREICRMVKGPVSLEVTSLKCGEMLEEARRLVTFGPNVVIKVPMTQDGLKAVPILQSRDIDTNVTLVFSPMQALLAARAGAAYVSPFVGRLDALAQNGMELVREIMTIFQNYNYPTQVIVASVRHPRHVSEAALLGAHAATIPYKIMMQLARHPLTDAGLETFLNDWAKLPPITRQA
ncbi:MAG: fructose-6-phosphate aldolase [Desulfovibrionaceae bacterium]|nr:fructose-6-phosphate aldolase [Desulfovibrionaceae bacterium]